MPALRRTSTAFLAIALVATLGAALAQPAYAAAPVTVDDHVTVYAGQFRQVDVLKNDSDADGDDLAVCRVAEPGKNADYYVEATGDSLLLVTDPDATGEITITYYACDYETLVPGTLTVSIKKVEPVTVKKLDRPGRLRVTNDNDRRVRFLYGSFKEERADGRVGIAPHDSVVVRVHRHRIDWVAILARTASAGTGRVRNIELPRDDRQQHARVPLDRADAKIWAAQH